MPIFLLEVRTEEIPANALPGARQQLEKSLAGLLQQAGFDGYRVCAESTSRRLVVMVTDLPERQPDRQERLTGPPRSVAFTDDGAPTRAAEGFARKAGVAVDQLEIATTSKGEYVAATVTHEGLATTEILAEAIPSVFASLRFPKMMRWGLGRHLFVRPVHGVVALLDDQVVPLELYGTASGRETVGHRVHAPETFIVADATSYLRDAHDRDVVVPHRARRTVLETAADTLAAEHGCTVHPDEALIAEHVELVEHPGLLCGAFDEAFLELPREVVITTLRHHQKCLVLERDGELAPHFLAVVDRRDDPEGLIRQGNEWVIGARLADARFFFDEDRKRPLEELVPGLERLELHRRLGSMADKANRVGELATFLASELGIQADPDELRRAAHLVKADLLSHMVGEFPGLQGVMGGHYLRLEGATEELWTAARDHYLPQGFEGSLPASSTGRLLAAADRLDTVVGLFAVDEKASGSRDPFGLRRAAQGMVRIMAEAGWALDPRDAIRRSVALVSRHADLDSEEVSGAVEGFVTDRIRRYLTDIVGVAGDTAEAVLAGSRRTLPELVARARALDGVREQPQFRSLALAFKRVRNITDGQPDSSVDPDLLAETGEHELHRAATEFHQRLQVCEPERRLDEAFAAMAVTAPVLDSFFDEVLVMAEDERIRNNRIALLQSLGRDFLALADLSKLHVEGGEQ